MSGIYIHIPFCRRKCNYCDFASCDRLSEIPRFLAALRSEFGQRDERIKRFETLYFGGGTPSVLPEKVLEELLSSTAGAFGDLKKFKETTFELNPESAGPAKLRLLREHGVNRLSIGLQSTHPARLKLLGRLASWEDFIETYRAARKAGFENVGADLIYGVPGQTPEEFKKDLSRLAALRPEHISAYCLELHEHTPLGRTNPAQDEETAADMYRTLTEFLAKKGYIHYEISNFSLTGRQSRHNMNYWDRGDYLGFGPSAASHVKNERWANVPELERYLLSLEKGRGGRPRPERAFTEKLTRKDALNEKMILGLRKIDGIELDGDIIIKFNSKLKELAEKGFLEFCQGNKPVEQAAFVAKSRILKPSGSDAKRGRSCNSRHLLRRRHCSAFSAQAEQPRCGPRCRRLCRRPKGRDCSRIGGCAAGLKVRIKKDFLFVSNSILSELIEA